MLNFTLLDLSSKWYLRMTYKVNLSGNNKKFPSVASFVERTLVQ